VALGVFDGKRIPHDLEGAPLQALLDAGEARTSFKHLALTHAEGKRWILVGLGSRDDFTPERARIAAALVHGRAREAGAAVLCWELPHKLGDAEVEAFVSGTLLAARRPGRYKRRAEDERPGVTALIASDHADRSPAVARAVVLAEAQNRARDLQDRAPNDLTADRAGRAREGARVRSGSRSRSRAARRSSRGGWALSPRSSPARPRSPR
jgi:leucyl aminopeptidase